MQKKKATLKRKYYTNFLLMIVVPILCVFIVAIGIINNMIRNAAVTNIKSAQGSISDCCFSETGYCINEDVYERWEKYLSER